VRPELSRHKQSTKERGVKGSPLEVRFQNREGEFKVRTIKKLLRFELMNENQLCGEINLSYVYSLIDLSIYFLVYLILFSVLDSNIR